MNKKRIYNFESDETTNERKVIGGNPVGVFELPNIKYQWAYKLYKTMLANTWFPEEVDLLDDARQYKLLDDKLKSAYDKALSQLIFMDSIQSNNLVDNINPYITAVEINGCLIRQAFEETLHSHSYAVLLESISEDKETIYNLWRDEPILREKNELIANLYINLSNEVNKKDLLLLMVANVTLEGIYFYSGFAYFYSLSEMGLMRNTANMIQFIMRDELTHLSLFQNMINSFKRDSEENMKLFKDNAQDMRDMIMASVDKEIDWGRFLFRDSQSIISISQIEKFVKYLGNKRSLQIGLGTLYPEIKENPIKWFKKYENFNSTQSNFFETKNINYSKTKLTFKDE